MRQPATLFFVFFFAMASAQTKSDSIQLVRNTVKLYDLDFTDAEADSMLAQLRSNASIYKGMHQTLPTNDIPYPFSFNPLPFGNTVPTRQTAINWELPAVQMPVNKNELAFYSISQLAFLIKNKKISSTELTRFFLDRLKKW